MRIHPRVLVQRVQAPHGPKCPGGVRATAALLFAVMILSGADAQVPELDELLARFVQEFVSLAPGTGSFPAEYYHGPPGKRERVKMSTPFRIAKYELPQNLYEAVMGENPSRWKGPRNSVEMVGWDEASAFCEKVTRLLRDRKLIRETEAVRLPTEREWEYACRAGSTSAYSFGDRVEDLDVHAWFSGNAAGNDPPVGAKKPNAWGLYDMHGYVWEWCRDAESKSEMPIRGGAWTSKADDCRSDSIRRVPRATRMADIGFRCVLSDSALQGD